MSINRTIEINKNLERFVELVEKEAGDKTIKESEFD